MRLYVEELRATPLVQEFTPTRTFQPQRVRLHLCKYLAPTGTFTVQITDASDNVLVSSSQTLAEMIALGSANLQANYYHGHVSFQFALMPTLRAGVTYKLKLTSSGYTYSDSTFIGWVKDSQGDPAIEQTGTPDSPVSVPYDYEFYTVQRVR